MFLIGKTQTARIAVLAGALGLMLLWGAVNGGRFLAGPQPWVRFILCALFAGLMLLRRRVPTPAAGSRALPLALASLAIAGSALALAGQMRSLPFLEWCGLVMFFGACLRWTLPEEAAPNAMRITALLFFLHPLPYSAQGATGELLRAFSASAATWLLHLANVSIWQEAQTLHTGLIAYALPNTPTGEESIQLLFLFSLGLSSLAGLRLPQVLWLTLAAAGQGLLLHVARIALIVSITPAVTDGTYARWMSGSQPAVYAIGLLLVLLEVTAVTRRQMADMSNTETQLSLPVGHSVFWLFLLKQKERIFAAVLVAILAKWILTQSSPEHRGALIKDVASSFESAGNLDSALRCTEQLLRANPEDWDNHLRKLRILLRQKHYEELVRYEENLPPLPWPEETSRQAGRKYSSPMETYLTERAVFRASALSASGKLKEAQAAFQKIPGIQDNPTPKVAMVLAEIAVHAGNPAEAARYVVAAAADARNQDRIRALYPYLKTHRQWAAIADADLGPPYASKTLALCVIEAFIHLSRTPSVARLCAAMTRAWPTDPLPLEPLFYMAMKRSDSKWEDLFSEHLKRCAQASMQPEELYRLFEKCFQLGRPDLAWTIYRRMESLNPGDPYLAMSIVWFGDSWFLFRREFLGFWKEEEEEIVDIRPFFQLGRLFPAWNETCRQVPLGDALSGPDASALKQQLLNQALQEFRDREAGGRLSIGMRYEYARALEKSGESAAALRQLELIPTLTAEETLNVDIARSEILERQNDWNAVYETLRLHLQLEDPQLPALMRLCRAQSHLHLGAAALYTARRAVSLFPDSPLALGTLAPALLQHGSAEDALFALERIPVQRTRAIDMLEAAALFRTQRFTEGLAFCRTTLIPIPPMDPETQQSPSLPPAENVMEWQETPASLDVDFAKNARALRETVGAATSPFLHRLMQFWLIAYDSRIAGITADPAQWEACGRDRIEKAIALNQLSLLLCWQGRMDEARQVAGVAVKRLPESILLWRLLIRLSGGDADVVKAARKSCPEDGELWLADILTRTRKIDSMPTDQHSQAKAELTGEIQRVVQAKLYPAGTLVRAGDFLLRHNLLEPAVIAAREASRNAKGLLPAHLLALRCASLTHDFDWAVLSTKKAIDASIRPMPELYRKIVELKSATPQVEIDSDMINALKNLRIAYPQDPIWAQMLGYVRFQRGGPDLVDAAVQMVEAIESGATNRIPYMVGAEAARRLGDLDRATELLRLGLQRHPTDLVMLNNLAFTLSLQTNHIQEALNLIPKLMQNNERNPSVLDTAASIYLAAGNLDQAETLLRQILEITVSQSKPRFRARLQLARIAQLRGNPVEASVLLESALKHAAYAASEDILAANELMADLANLTRQTLEAPSKPLQ